MRHRRQVDAIGHTFLYENPTRHNQAEAARINSIQGHCRCIRWMTILHPFPGDSACSALSQRARFKLFTVLALRTLLCHLIRSNSETLSTRSITAQLHHPATTINEITTFAIIPCIEQYLQLAAAGAATRVESTFTRTIRTTAGRLCEPPVVRVAARET